MEAVNGVNLVLGAAGLVVVSGLLAGRGWGYWGTILVSLATVAFDGVSSISVSFTAFAGLVLPVAFLVILLPARETYFSSRVGGQS